MARPYASEMAQLSETLEWATSADVTLLRNAIRTAGLGTLRAIGSGGSLTAAQMLASCHEHFAGRMASVITPLEARDDTTDPSASHWLLSAGGGNVDILASARALIFKEPRQIAALCGRADSPLADLCGRHPFVDLLLFPPPAGKDGFLATNSLLGFSILLTRAYAMEFNAGGEWDDATDRISAILGPDHATLGQWEDATSALWCRPTTLVLYGSATKVGAIDLESKFIEAALGNVHLADYRNFAHGRHHWLAKRGDVSGILALVSDHDRTLAERTLALIPDGIPVARIEAPGERSAASLTALVAALQVTGWAGAARGIDPGRPGVPDFGRKLYSLPLPKRRRTHAAKLTDRDSAAIQRKTGVSLAALQGRGDLDHWRDALAAFRAHLHQAEFAGVVLDYDGTVVDTRERFHPPPAAMVNQLRRLLENDVPIGIATGRGVSVRRDLQAVLPRQCWGRVLVGYYNGAQVAALSDDSVPDGSEDVCVALAPLATALRSQPELAGTVQQTDRPKQITLEPLRQMPEGRLWDLAQQIILMGGFNVSVTRSSHSIDIVPEGVSKLNVVQQLQKFTGTRPLLAIGDRGRWPGNDYELLRLPHALGVDEISVDPATCWNLGSPGQRGAGVTLDYLSGLVAIDGRCSLPIGRLS